MQKTAIYCVALWQDPISRPLSQRTKTTLEMQIQS